MVAKSFLLPYIKIVNIWLESKLADNLHFAFKQKMIVLKTTMMFIHDIFKTARICDNMKKILKIRINTGISNNDKRNIIQWIKSSQYHCIFKLFRNLYDPIKQKNLLKFK